MNLWLTVLFKHPDEENANWILGKGVLGHDLMRFAHTSQVTYLDGKNKFKSLKIQRGKDTMRRDRGTIRKKTDKTTVLQ